MHRLLELHIKEHFGGAPPEGPAFAAFLSVVDVAYHASSDPQSATANLAATVAHEINTPIQYLSDGLGFVREASAGLVGLGEVLLGALGGGREPVEVLEALGSAAGVLDLDHLLQELPRALAQCEDGIKEVAGVVAALAELGRPAPRSRGLPARDPAHEASPPTEAAPLPRVLFVDDEPRVLDGLRRLLRRSFSVTTVESGAQALSLLDAGEPFEVVVSDMQMPRMNGTALLSEFRRRAPDTVRVLLTGHVDFEAANASQNRGEVFRFLTKPCPTEELTMVLHGAVAQHRLLTGERILLEETLVLGMRALVDVLARFDPEVCGVAARELPLIRAVAERMGATAWSAEVAAMFRLASYTRLEREVASAVLLGEPLAPAERGRIAAVYAELGALVGRIPRLEGVCAVLRDAVSPEERPESIEAQILRAVSQFCALEAREGSAARAMQILSNAGAHPADVVAALAHASERR